MRILAIGNGGTVKFDTETQEIDSVESAREGIRRIYRITEPCHVKFNDGKYTEEADVNAGDIVILFWEQQFPHKMIVVNNQDWNENFDNYEKAMEAQKEKWAMAKSCDDSETCGDCSECGKA